MSGRRQRRKRKARGKQRVAQNAKKTTGTPEAPVEIDPEELERQRKAEQKRRIAQLRVELEKAEAVHAELFASSSEAYAHLRAVHLAAERVWVLRSSICYVSDLHDAARKAATTANEHARQAARLERDSLADRVAALEAEMELGRDLGRDLEEV